MERLVEGEREEEGAGGWKIGEGVVYSDGNTSLFK